MDAIMLLLHLLQQRSQIVIYSDKWHCWFFLMTRWVNYKGKMANSRKMSGAFWLLDSGASHHFTSNLRDFASYQELKHKHLAKMANGVAEIAGIGTVLLSCLDPNTGDEC